MATCIYDHWRLFAGFSAQEMLLTGPQKWVPVVHVIASSAKVSVKYNALKKYSRAAGDRSQVKNVDAMLVREAAGSLNNVNGRKSTTVGDRQ